MGVLAETALESSGAAAPLDKPAQAAGQVQSVNLLWLWQTPCASAQTEGTEAASQATI